MLVVGGSVVAGAGLQLYVGAVDFNGEPAVAAVLGGVGGAKTDHVVGRGVLLDALKGRGKVVGIEESLASSIRRQGGHHFLGVEVGIEIVLQGCAVVTAGAAQTTGARV